MAQSRIEWTDCTWNPVTGCTKLSPGCDNCYAERMARRLRAMGQPKCAREFEVVTHEECLADPLEWTSPHVIFVNSMSDLFHPSVCLEFIQRVFATMRAADHHIFQLLTKRSGRMAQLACLGPQHSALLGFARRHVIRLRFPAYGRLSPYKWFL